MHIFDFKISFCELQHMDTLVLTNQQRFTYISTVQTLDAFKRTCQEQWLLATNGDEE